jgi:hypothetical protein
MNTLHAPSKRMREHFDYDDRLQSCLTDCNRNEMEVVALAASDVPSELCPECQIALLKSMILTACIHGMEILARSDQRCEDVEDINFVEYSGSWDKDDWQEFIFGEQEGEKPTFRITITHKMEEW